MDISSIIHKDKLHTDEMKYVVQEYIKEKKGKDVIVRLMLDEGVFDFREWSLFNTAYNTALAHFMKKEQDEKN